MKRKIITVLLALSLMLTACSTQEKTESEITSSEESTSSVESEIAEDNEEDITTMPGAVNPYIEVTSSDDFKIHLDIVLAPPEGAEDIMYFLVLNSMAQIDYIKGDTEYTLRAAYSSQGQELHGVYGDIAVEGESMAIENEKIAANILVVENVDGVKIATATISQEDKEDLHLSLTTDGDVSLSEVLLDLMVIVENR